MKKVLLTEISRINEIMGIKNKLLLNEGIIDYLESLIAKGESSLIKNSLKKGISSIEMQEVENAISTLEKKSVQNLTQDEIENIEKLMALNIDYRLMAKQILDGGKIGPAFETWLKGAERNVELGTWTPDKAKNAAKDFFDKHPITMGNEELKNALNRRVGSRVDEKFANYKNQVKTKETYTNVDDLLELSKNIKETTPAEIFSKPGGTKNLNNILDKLKSLSESELKSLDTTTQMEIQQEINKLEALQPGIGLKIGAWFSKIKQVSKVVPKWLQIVFGLILAGTAAGTAILKATKTGAKAAGRGAKNVWDVWFSDEGGNTESNTTGGDEKTPVFDMNQ